MRKFFILLGSAVAMTSFAHAENWTGKLIDASCYDRQHNSGQSSQTPGQTSATQAQSSTSTSSQSSTSQAGQAGQSTTARSSSVGSQDTACVATSTTTQFALEASAGKVYKLDENGNTRAMAAMRSRADRSSTAGQSSTTTGGATSSTQSQQSGIMAKVDGTESGGTIKVTTIELQ